MAYQGQGLQEEASLSAKRFHDEFGCVESTFKQCLRKAFVRVTGMCASETGIPGGIIQNSDVQNIIIL